MGLGMHPASLYPRRSRIAPTGKSGEGSLAELTLQLYRFVKRPVKPLIILKLLGLRVLTPVYCDPHNAKTQQFELGSHLAEQLETDRRGSRAGSLLRSR
jgi:hypothetical protein